MLYLTYIVVFVVIILVFIILYKIFKFIVSILLIGLFVVIAYFTNPSEERHRAAVIEKLEKENLTARPVVDRENYYVFSLTSVNKSNDRKIIGAGAFTRVFIFSKP
jgi:hypothetical protein